MAAAEEATGASNKMAAVVAGEAAGQAAAVDAKETLAEAGSDAAQHSKKQVAPEKKLQRLPERPLDVMQPFLTRLLKTLARPLPLQRRLQVPRMRVQLRWQ